MNEAITNLVDLSITDTGSAGESAGGRESEGGRSDGARSGRRKGRASRPGEGGNAAARDRLAQLGPIEREMVQKVDQVVGTNLLNIFTDD